MLLDEGLPSHIFELADADTSILLAPVLGAATIAIVEVRGGELAPAVQVGAAGAFLAVTVDQVIAGEEGVVVNAQQVR